MNESDDVRVEPIVQAPQENPIAVALAAQSKAAVAARYEMALRQPRVMADVEQAIFRECKRSDFAADKSALYVLPRGKTTIEGLGIRFAEMAVQSMTNVYTEVMQVVDTDDYRLLKVAVMDLQNNLSYSRDVHVPKTVERSRPADDGTFLSVRTNAQGKPVYLIPASQDAIATQEAALVSKAMRTLALRLLPAHIKREAMALIKQTRESKVRLDPDAERRALADAFAKIHVSVKDLQRYLGHALEQTTPSELVTLRGIWAAIHSGEATWADYMAAATEEGTPGASAVREKLKTKAAEKDEGQDGNPPEKQ